MHLRNIITFQNKCRRKNGKKENEEETSAETSDEWH